MQSAETGSRTAILCWPRSPRQAAFAVASVRVAVRPAACGGANATVQAARRGYGAVTANAGERRRLRSNNTIQRRPRSAVLINSGVPLAAPLMVSVGRLTTFVLE